MTPIEASVVPVVGEPDRYDAGLLNDYGGGDISWWQDYIRCELDRAHEHYVGQFSADAITRARLDELQGIHDEYTRYYQPRPVWEVYLDGRLAGLAKEYGVVFNRPRAAAGGTTQ